MPPPPVMKPNNFLSLRRYLENVPPVDYQYYAANGKAIQGNFPISQHARACSAIGLNPEGIDKRFWVNTGSL